MTQGMAMLAAGARGRLAIGVLLAAVTVAVFAPAVNGQFLNWDDDLNLLRNSGYRGLTPGHLRWIFTTTLGGHYIPMTWLTFALDHTFWGMDPRGYHLTNVVLHAAAVIAFFAVALRVLRRATALADGPRALAAGVAVMFFAVHPLRAESVAWATERRDVLCGLFSLLAILGYLVAQESDGPRRRRALIASLVAYALALASKSIVMGLPLVLLVLDIYPLGRLGPGRRNEAVRAVLREKVPYAVLGLIGAAVAYWAVQSTVLTPLETLPWSARVAMIFYTFAFHVTKTAVPVGLSPLYELPMHFGLLEWPFALPALGVVAATAGFVAARKRWPAGLAAWTCFVILLAPVSGVVHSGSQVAHDRYSYLSCLPWALLVGAAFGLLAVRAFPIGPRLRAIALGVVAAWLLTLAVLTSHQVRVWHDSSTLWTYAVDSEPSCALCHGNLAAALLLQDDLEGAMRAARTALALRPDLVRPHATLGLALGKAGRPAEAIPHFEAFLSKFSRDAETFSSLGIALLAHGRPEEAIDPLRRAVDLKPDNRLLRTNYARGLLALGSHEAAREQYRRAAEGRP